MARRRVLLLLKVFNHLTYEGIMKYALEAGWHLDLRYYFYRQFPENWQGDGIISNHAGDPSVCGFIEESSLPAVDIGWRTKSPSLPKVWFDNHGIGKAASRYFLDKGFRHFGFFDYLGGMKNLPWHRLRYSGFCENIEAEGYECLPLRSGSLVADLKGAPKPLAVLANNDMNALTVFEGCEEAGFCTPEQVAILGIDNNPDFCKLAPVPLSSVDSNSRGVGYHAAELLDALMAGASPPEEPITVSHGGVVTRQSTDILAVPHLPTARALRYLAENYPDDQLDLNVVAREVGISRRNLEAGFKRHLGYTMFDRLERLRMDEAIRLLRTSDWRGHEIAAMCGFTNTDHLSRVLKKHHGKSLRQMRALSSEG